MAESKMPERIWAYCGGVSVYTTAKPANGYFHEYLRADLVDEMAKALENARKALTEAEAILGGEYGDHHSVLCELMLDLDQRANTTLSRYRAAVGDKS